MKLSALFLALASVFLLSACQDNSQSSQSEKREPASALQALQLDKVSIKEGIGSNEANLDLIIEPVPLTSADHAEALLRNCNEEISYQWSVNSQIMADYTTDSLDRETFRQGDIIELTVTCGNFSLTAETTVKNGPPSIAAVKFEDPVLEAGKDLTVIPSAIDYDDDPIDYSYEWKINGIIQEEVTGPTLPGELLTKGTEVQLAVTAYDGITSGATFQGLGMVIPNSPPVITSQPPPLMSAQYVYQVEVDDPDDDALYYRLSKGPEGMAIDATSGVLTWSVTQSTPRAIYEIEVTVADNEDAQARQSFSLSLVDEERQ
ncbi:hypothetical protein SAMN02745165_02149 [Malonomonas rubra DSM 5091]|uniref:Uncharacterized protein n=1 Tax=Malonomonas rubra DSM 5091 TaxID=1122189 RepID=A0A1M6IKS0_MALRU|nr:putative Ig domain-containing protein [Malonomonas rubra]SHJ35076.1 hypothetical protein SAMN02745165_02149 [Malonomonas rubra DSM 5091]